MKIPSILFGTGKQVHRKAKRFLNRIIKDGIFPEFSPSELIETDLLYERKTDPLVMFTGDVRRGSQEHFRAYVFQNYNPNRGGEYLWEDTNLVFDGLVKHDWGLFCLIAAGTMVPLRDREPERNKLFFSRLLAFWPFILENRNLFYDSEKVHHGGAYFWQNGGSDLWSILSESGVQEEEFHDIISIGKNDRFIPELIIKYQLA